MRFMHKERFFTLTTVFGTLLICLIILEICVRVINPQSDLRRRDLFFRYEPVMGVEGIPRKEGVFATNMFNTTITHNSQGFRDVERSEEKTGNKWRILCLGDSFTWGHGVENEEIYVKVLEKLHPRIETVNMGGPGDDPAGELKVYLYRGWDYAPDLVLVGFYLGNDVRPYYPTEETVPPQFGFDEDGDLSLMGRVLSDEEVEKVWQTSEERYSPEGRRDLRGKIKYWLIKHIQLYTFIDNFQDYYADVLKGSLLYTKTLKLFGIDNHRGLGFLNYCMEKDPQNVADGWRTVEAAFSALKDFTSMNGANLYIVFIPHIAQTSRDLYERNVRSKGYDPREFDLEKPNRRLTQILEKYHIDYLDLLPPFQKATERGKILYYPRDPHWTPEGHRIAAREIYSDFIGRGWIEDGEL